MPRLPPCEQPGRRLYNTHRSPPLIPLPLQIAQSEDSFVYALIAGLIAGVPGAGLTVPCDVIKTRMQSTGLGVHGGAIPKMRSEKCPSVLNAHPNGLAFSTKRVSWTLRPQAFSSKPAKSAALVTLSIRHERDADIALVSLGSIRATVANLYAEGGVGAFWKGAGPRVGRVAPQVREALWPCLWVLCVGA